MEKESKNTAKKIVTDPSALSVASSSAVSYTSESLTPIIHSDHESGYGSDMEFDSQFDDESNDDNNNENNNNSNISEDEKNSEVNINVGNSDNEELSISTHSQASTVIPTSVPHIEPTELSGNIPPSTD